MNQAAGPCPVNSHNEWDKLEEIVIGSIAGAYFPEFDASMQSFFQPSTADLRKHVCGPVPQRLIEETEEDVQGFADQLAKLGVTVRRPAPLKHAQPVASPYWKTHGLNALNARDGLIVFGQQILEAPMACRARHFESWAYKDLFLDYFRAGAHWVSAPKPRLLDSTFLGKPDGPAAITEDEPIFDAANMFRCGRDIFFNKSNTGNEMGIKWLKRHLAERYQVHVMSVSDDHIGTTIVPLRPGMLLVNPARVSIDKIHPLLRNWDIIWAPDPVPQKFGLPWAVSSNWIGMNVLSIDATHVVVEKSQTPLMKALESKGFTPVPVAYRHGRTFGGSFHCISLDIRRKGGLEDYFR